MGVTAGLLLVAAASGLGAFLIHRLEGRFVSPPREAGPFASREATDARVLNADRWLYPAAPVVAALGIAWASVVLPFGPGLIGSDLGIGVFYFIVVVDFVVLGLALGGWASNTPAAVEVYYRVTAQLVAYVVPLGLVLMGPIMMAKSLSTVAIVEAQADVWFVLYQPQAFALYLICGAMQTYRRPFLEPFAGSIDGGIWSVYGGVWGIVWRYALSGLLFVVAAMGAVLFLGGWHGPFLPEPVGGPAWMTVKTLGVAALILGLGRRLPELSTAGMLRLAWRYLIPAGLLNVLIVGGLILLGVGPA